MIHTVHSGRSQRGSGVAVTDIPAQAGTPGTAIDDRAVIINPSALTVEQLARALGVSAEVVRRHVQDGVPTDGGGRINLMQYAAWLNYRLTQVEQACHGEAERSREDGRGD